MQVLVLFYSRGGNTRKLGEEIAKGVESTGMKVVIKSTQDVTKKDFQESTGIIAGSPVYFGGMAADLKRIFDEFVGVRKEMENKIGAAFATGAHHTGGKETTMLSILHSFLIYGMIIVGDPMAASGHYGVACLQAPDETAASDAFKLGARVADLCKKLQ